MVFRLILVTVIAFSLSLSPVHVQAQVSPYDTGAETTAGGPRKQLATIIFAGLGGAILGLSTLSFYGRPQDHLSNIAIGFGVGIIGGTILMTYQAASNPREFYGTGQPVGSLLVPESEFVMARTNEQINKARLGFSYQF